MINAAADSQVVALKRWIEEPHTFASQCFGVELDPWQERELRVLPAHDRVAVAGSKGCAKTAWLSMVIWWSLLTQPDVKIAVTSINGTQLRDGLWTELALWQNKSPLLRELFHWSAERIVRKSEPATWFASARTWNKDADPNTQGQSLAGIHGKNCLFVIDEAGGVPAVLLSAADAVLATKRKGHNLRVLVTGNTTSTAGALYQAMTRQRSMWHCVHVTSDPNDPDRTPRVSKEWAQQWIDAYGRSNPWVKINILAEFPETALGKLLSLADCQAATSRIVEQNLREPLVLGVDVGTVTDAAIIYPRRGRLLHEPIVMRGASTIVIASRVVEAAREFGATAVFVDAGGPGIGVVDQVRALGLTQMVPVFFGYAADDPTRYANKRVEMYHRAAEWVVEGGALGKADELVQDLLEPEVGWNLKGQKILEPKEAVKGRLGRSPDWGDGFALTFAYPVAAPPEPGDAMAEIARAMGRHMGDWGGGGPSRNFDLGGL